MYRFLTVIQLYDRGLNDLKKSTKNNKICYLEVDVSRSSLAAL